MIDIKEVVIRAIIVEDGNRPDAGRKTGPVAPAPMTDEARAQLIEDCVRQVLAILERQTER